MKDAGLDIVKEWFGNHVRGFASPTGEVSSPLQLKVEHSKRVANDVRALAQEMEWTTGDVNTAEAAAWLHDIGRFSQFSEFGTFADARSVNHGELGWGIVSQSNLVSHLNPHDQACVLDSIRHHNSRKMPNHLGNGSKPCLQLIRDADKLDIFRIVHESIKKDGFRELPEMLPQIDLGGSASPTLLNELYTKQCASLDNVASLADFLLMQLSWIYDINYVGTFVRILERDIITNIVDQLPRQNEKVNGIVQTAKDFINERI